jgi:hypothetical protein
MAETNGTAKRKFKPYKSYKFLGKDPVIAEMRQAVEATDTTYAQMHEDSGVAKTTFYNWFKGKTRRPQYAACQAAMKAIGYGFVLRKDE